MRINVKKKILENTLAISLYFSYFNLDNFTKFLLYQNCAFNNWRRLLRLNNSALTENQILGGLQMAVDTIIALVTCVATVITTVLAALSYHKRKDEE